MDISWGQFSHGNEALGAQSQRGQEKWYLRSKCFRRWLYMVGVRQNCVPKSVCNFERLLVRANKDWLYYEKAF